MWTFLVFSTILWFKGFVIAQETTPVSTIYYPVASSSVQPYTIDCYHFTLCGTNFFETLRVDIDLPENYIWNVNSGVVFVEIYNCPSGEYNPACLLGCNYIYQAQPVVYHNITVPLSNANNDTFLSIRVIGAGAQADYTFTVSFVDNLQPIVNGTYNAKAFGSNPVCNNNIQQIGQYAFTSEQIEIPLAKINCFFTTFCVQDFATITSWSLSYSMVASSTEPNSAFIGWVCEGYQNSSSCTQFNNIYPGQKLPTVAVTSGQLSSDEFYIDNGNNLLFRSWWG